MVKKNLQAIWGEATYGLVELLILGCFGAKMTQDMRQRLNN